jgi:acetylornithine aminotransferase
LEGVAGVESVRGRGLLLAAVLSAPVAPAVTERSLVRGLVVNAVRPDAVRFAPPLTITSNEVEEAVRLLTAALAEVRDG